MKRYIHYFRIIFQNRILGKFIHPKPSALRIFYAGGYWRGPNDMVAQMLGGLKATGVNLIDFNSDLNLDALDTEGRPFLERGVTGPVWLKRERLFPLILKFRPHIIICNAGGLSFRPEDAAFLRKLGIKLLTFVLSDPEVYEPTTRKTAQNFDVLYSFVPEYVEKYRQHGPQAYLLPMATNQAFFHPAPGRKEYECEVLHLGAVHADRIEPVKALVENFDTHVRGENWENYGVRNHGLLFGEDVLSALNSAKIAVIFSRTISGFQGVKVGLLDFLAAGGLVVTEDFPLLHRYFEVGREIIAFSDTQDMIGKIKYYLDHPEEAEAIRKAGRERVINNLTWDKVFPRVLPTVMQINGWPLDTDWINSYFLPEK
ncbi:MAG: glycosyltransferase [Chloroflexi bacterium]|nr:glycosyltransferase [Chloroflexota bacterium]